MLMLQSFEEGERPANLLHLGCREGKGGHQRKTPVRTRSNLTKLINLRRRGGLRGKGIEGEFGEDGVVTFIQKKGWSSY